MSAEISQDSLVPFVEAEVGAEVAIGYLEFYESMVAEIVNQGSEIFADSKSSYNNFFKALAYLEILALPLPRKPNFPLAQNKYQNLERKHYSKDQLQGALEETSEEESFYWQKIDKIRSGAFNMTFGIFVSYLNDASISNVKMEIILERLVVLGKSYPFVDNLINDALTGDLSNGGKFSDEIGRDLERAEKRYQEREEKKRTHNMSDIKGHEDKLFIELKKMRSELFGKDDSLDDNMEDYPGLVNGLMPDFSENEDPLSKTEKIHKFFVEMIKNNLLDQTTMDPVFNREEPYEISQLFSRLKEEGHQTSLVDRFFLVAGVLRGVKIDYLLSVTITEDSKSADDLDLRFLIPFEGKTAVINPHDLAQELRIIEQEYLQGYGASGIATIGNNNLENMKSFANETRIFNRIEAVDFVHAWANLDWNTPERKVSKILKNNRLFVLQTLNQGGITLEKLSEIEQSSSLFSGRREVYSLFVREYFSMRAFSEAEKYKSRLFLQIGNALHRAWVQRELLNNSEQDPYFEPLLFLGMLRFSLESKDLKLTKSLLNEEYSKLPPSPSIIWEITLLMAKFDFNQEELGALAQGFENNIENDIYKKYLTAHKLYYEEKYSDSLDVLIEILMWFSKHEESGSSSKEINTALKTIKEKDSFLREELAGKTEESTKIFLDNFFNKNLLDHRLENLVKNALRSSEFRREELLAIMDKIIKEKSSDEKTKSKQAQKKPSPQKSERINPPRNEENALPRAIQWEKMIDLIKGGVLKSRSAISTSLLSENSPGQNLLYREPKDPSVQSHRKKHFSIKKFSHKFGRNFRFTNEEDNLLQWPDFNLATEYFKKIRLFGHKMPFFLFKNIDLIQQIQDEDGFFVESVMGVGIFEAKTIDDPEKPGFLGIGKKTKRVASVGNRDIDLETNTKYLVLLGGMMSGTKWSSNFSGEHYPHPLGLDSVYLQIDNKNTLKKLLEFFKSKTIDTDILLGALVFGEHGPAKTFVDSQNIHSPFAHNVKFMIESRAAHGGDDRFRYTPLELAAVKFDSSWARGY